MSGRTASSWTRFWERGGWWRAVILAAVYYGIYELLVFGIDGTVGASIPEDGGAGDVLVHTAVPIILGVAVLLAFAASVGWLRDLFARQGISGRRWMWTGVIIILAINVSSLLSVEYARAGLPLVAVWLFAGLFIGLAEELLARGLVVNLMRKAGHGEITVALVSSAIFGLLHAGNVFFGDQDLGTTAIQVVYTSAFGVCMYLALRATGTIWAPILLHASSDPFLFLHAEYPQNNLFSVLPGLSTYLVIVMGTALLVALIVSERRRPAAARHR